MSHLPHDTLSDNGVVCYLRSVWSSEQVARFTNHLRENIPWHHQMYSGKRAKRATAWFADKGVAYRYTGQSMVGDGWDSVVDEIRRDVQQLTKVGFNSVLLHRYPDGKSQMGWHSDAEAELGLNPVIASVSFGAARVFKLRHKISKEIIEYTLEDNSLLIMAGRLQHHFEHSVPSRPATKAERFNLTFRYTIPA
jgi:alkylated DNA repair dioxygenase AlkB